MGEGDRVRNLSHCIKREVLKCYRRDYQSHWPFYSYWEFVQLLDPSRGSASQKWGLSMIDRILSLFWPKTLNPPMSNDRETPGLTGGDLVVDAKLQISH